MSNLSTAAATVLLNYVRDNATRIKLYNGTMPASTAAAHTGTLILDFPVATLTPVVDGRTLTYTGTVEATGLANGTPTYFTLSDASGDIYQGASTGITLSPASVTLNIISRLTSCVFTVG